MLSKVSLKYPSTITTASLHISSDIMNNENSATAEQPAKKPTVDPVTRKAINEALLYQPTITQLTDSGLSAQRKRKQLKLEREQRAKILAEASEHTSPQNERATSESQSEQSTAELQATTDSYEVVQPPGSSAASDTKPDRSAKCIGKSLQAAPQSHCTDVTNQLAVS